MPVLRLVIAFVLLVIAGCEQRPAITRGSASGSAGSLQMREGLSWGEPTEILEPTEPTLDGRWWWQVRYADGANGRPRIILVDRSSGWSRRPPPDWQVRVPAQPYDPPDHAVIQPGPFILILNDPRPGSEESQLRVDAAELNRLAGRTGLMPAFSVRTGRDASCQLIYGWQGDRGMKRDERVRDWLLVRTRWQASRWVELGVE